MTLIKEMVIIAAWRSLLLRKELSPTAKKLGLKSANTSKEMGADHQAEVDNKAGKVKKTHNGSQEELAKAQKFLEDHIKRQATTPQGGTNDIETKDKGNEQTSTDAGSSRSPTSPTFKVNEIETEDDLAGTTNEKIDKLQKENREKDGIIDKLTKERDEYSKRLTKDQLNKLAENIKNGLKTEAEVNKAVDNACQQEADKYKNHIDPTNKDKLKNAAKEAGFGFEKKDIDNAREAEKAGWKYTQNNLDTAVNNEKDKYNAKERGMVSKKDYDNVLNGKKKVEEELSVEKKSREGIEKQLAAAVKESVELSTKSAEAEQNKNRSDKAAKENYQRELANKEAERQAEKEKFEEDLKDKQQTIDRLSKIVGENTITAKDLELAQQQVKILSDGLGRERTEHAATQRALEETQKGLNAAQTERDKRPNITNEHAETERNDYRRKHEAEQTQHRETKRLLTTAREARDHYQAEYYKEKENHESAQKELYEVKIELRTEKEQHADTEKQLENKTAELANEKKKKEAFLTKAHELGVQLTTAETERDAANTDKQNAQQERENRPDITLDE
ncbi:34806_t:CDS:2 [Racocetra persica]|uniref:34804_t:CDS:1 n=2 Tax=Racocetra persica TaxID=160502 RepID=A0ACA9L5G0_9GLOM|nr:34804_t:CDS:2 [Racocetra persica]CAG8508359.1 34806_t:CDS:2 [Racocetra persica]